MSQPLEAGVAVGRFILDERLDDFGLGEVWKARDEKFRNRPVVVKLLRSVESDELPEALEQHLDALRGLRHPLVLPVIHHGVWSQRPYIAQEHFDGVSLGTLLDRSREARAPIALPRLLAIFSAISVAVESGHTADPAMVHGAISPASVLVGGTDDAPVVRLIDLGLEPHADPLAAPRNSARSAPCKAPEQYAKEPITTATDIFSLGLLLMEMLAATAEVRATSPVLWRYVGRDDVPDTIWDAILGATKQAPAERYATPTEFVDALAAAWARAAEEEAAAGADVAPAAIAPVAPTAPEPAAPTAPEPAPEPVRAPMPAVVAQSMPMLPAAMVLPTLPRVPLDDSSAVETLVRTERRPEPAEPEPDALEIGERTQMQESDLSLSSRTVMLSDTSLSTERPRIALSTVEEESTIVKGKALQMPAAKTARPAPRPTIPAGGDEEEIHLPESRTVMMESVGFWASGPRASSVPPANPDDSSARSTGMFSKRRIAQMSSLSKMVTGLDELRLGEGPIAMPKLDPIAPSTKSLPALPKDPPPPAAPAVKEPPKSVTTLTWLLAALLLAVALWAFVR